MHAAACVTSEVSKEASKHTGAWKTLLWRPASLMPEKAAYGLASAIAAASACLAASASLLVALSDRRALAIDSGPARKRAYMSSVLALHIKGHAGVWTGHCTGTTLLLIKQGRTYATSKSRQQPTHVSFPHTAHLPEPVLDLADMRLVVGDSFAGEPARLAGTLRGPPGRSKLPLMDPRLTDERLTDVRLIDGRPPPSRACGPADADLRLHSSRAQPWQSTSLASNLSTGCRLRRHTQQGKAAHKVVSMPSLRNQVLRWSMCRRDESAVVL